MIRLPMVSHHSSSSGLFDTFLHGAAWSAARRIIHSLPMPLVIVFVVILALGAITKRLIPRKPVMTRTVVTKHVDGDTVTTDKTVYPK